MADADSTRPATPLEITLTDETLTRMRRALLEQAPPETLATLREALLIGLAAYGEIERLSDAQEIRARRGIPIERDLRVTHPTGASDTVSRFANALRILE